ncbi:MAG: head-tail connector protein [Lachnospiraceae bacterium]|nr:head-tail connector protein [Lachnospiraceae bacterium]MCH4067221.1 head-tail connector protein [Lachnospiraceae bacterium]MCH4113247.1 head-tail connector protein [Lachnospiraceae bacterium]
MALLSLSEVKEYLRVDTADEDATIGILLQSAERLCVDVARLTKDQWEVINSDAEESELYSKDDLSAIRETMKVAILYATAYLFEHREEADHHALALTLRSILFAIREGVNE